MKSTHSIHPCLLKVAVAVSIATGTLGFAQAAGIAPEGQAAGTSQYILNTDRLIVKYKDSGSAVFKGKGGPPAMTAARQSIADRAGQEFGMKLQALRTTANGAHVLKIDRKVSVKEADALAQELMARDASVEYAEPDRIMRKMATANDPHVRRSSGTTPKRPAACACRPPGTRTTGTGVKVAVIDTGIRPHADLVRPVRRRLRLHLRHRHRQRRQRPRQRPSRSGRLDRRQRMRRRRPASSSSWHGTHVAGTIAAMTNNAWASPASPTTPRSCRCACSASAAATPRTSPTRSSGRRAAPSAACRPMPTRPRSSTCRSAAAAPAAPPPRTRSTAPFARHRRHRRGR